MLEKLKDMKETLSKLNDLFRDPSVRTFVCVCIPEFLSENTSVNEVQELNQVKSIRIKRVAVEEKLSIVPSVVRTEIAEDLQLADTEGSNNTDVQEPADF